MRSVRSRPANILCAVHPHAREEDPAIGIAAPLPGALRGRVQIYYRVRPHQSCTRALRGRDGTDRPARPHHGACAFRRLPHRIPAPIGGERASSRAGSTKLSMPAPARWPVEALREPRVAPPDHLHRTSASAPTRLIRSSELHRGSAPDQPKRHTPSSQPHSQDLRQDRSGARLPAYLAKNFWHRISDHAFGSTRKLRFLGCQRLPQRPSGRTVHERPPHFGDPRS